MTTTTTAEHGGGAVRNPWPALLVVCLGIFMIFLDTTIVNVAVPSIMDGIHASLDQLLWVLNAYLLTYAVLLIPSGRLGDILGQRTVFQAGLAVFSIASASCGLAANGPELIVARVFQGLGAALLTPQCLVIIAQIFPPTRRGMALGIFAAVGGLASMTGPLAGGLIAGAWNWRWIFFVNVPIGAVAIVLAFLHVPSVRTGGSRSLDPLGVLLGAGGLLGVMFGLIEGERFAWGTVAGPIGIREVIGVGLLLLVAFAVQQRRRDDPLVPPVLFRTRNFAIMVWLTAVMAFALFGMLLVTVIDLRSVLSMSPLQAGLTASPLTIAATLISPLAGKLCDMVGSRLMLICGSSVAAVGILWLALGENAGSTSLTFIVPASVMGVGMGFTFAPLLTAALREIPPELSGSAAGVLTTARQLGSALGTAVIGGVLQNRLVAGLPGHSAAVSAALPASMRDRFIQTATRQAGSGLRLGPGQMLDQAVPGPLGSAVAAPGLLRQALVDTYVAAMRPALAVAAGALLLGATTCLWIRRAGPGHAARSLAGHGRAAVKSSALAPLNRRAPS